MDVLRRLFGGSRGPAPADDVAAEGGATDSTTADEDERAHELELARFEQDRTDDLMRRQQRYSSYAWTPPAEGGERRADEGDADADG